MSSYPVDRCRWRRRVGSAQRRPPNNGTQHTARGSSGTSLSSSERLYCSKSVVELRVRSTTIHRLEIRAHTRIVSNSAVRACFCGKKRHTDRTGCSVAREQYTGGTGDVRAENTGAYCHVAQRRVAGLRRSNKLSAKRQARPIYTCTPKS